MEEILFWIKAHWQYVSAGLILLVNLVLFLIKKKPVKVIDSVTRLIAEQVCFLVNRAEKEFGAGHGDEKLDYVINEMNDYFIKNCPGINIEYYLGVVERYVEMILSTPQKKKGE